MQSGTNTPALLATHSLLVLATFWSLPVAEYAQQSQSLSGKVSIGTSVLQSGQIHLFQLLIRNGIREIYSKCTDEINESGEFHCKELSAGIFLLQIEPGITPSAIPWARQCSSTPRAFYYPASVDFDKATLITIAPHQAAWVDVQVPSLASYDLHADVPDAPATARAVP